MSLALLRSRLLGPMLKKFLGIVGKILVVLNLAGYKLTSSSYALFIWGIFDRFL
jgi:hypothetical protein